MHDAGLANLALSMGRQRLGRLTLWNHPQFLQNLHIDGQATRSTSQRSTSFATGNEGFPVSMNSAGNTG